MNKDDYKEALNQIHATDELKQKTIEKMNNNTNKNTKYLYAKILSVCAVIICVFSISLIELNKNTDISDPVETPPIAEKKVTIAKANSDLPRFKNINELKNVLKDYAKRQTRLAYNSSAKEDVALAAVEDLESAVEAPSAENSNTEGMKDYSTTNVQVENVDEADIVKTDGEYIYHVVNGEIKIVDTKSFKVASTIEYTDSNEKFYPREIFINEDKLVVLGNLTKYEENVIFEDDALCYSDIARVDTANLAMAIVYDISNKKEPKKVREAGLDGNYVNSRMIGDNLYFISSKYLYYYKEMRDDELLPRVLDTAAAEEESIIACTDIAYFRGTNSYGYMLVGGLNINRNEEICVETFFGASSKVYASEKNLYITQEKYDNKYSGCSSTIYKFELDDANIKLLCKGEVEGYMNNQFSMDEYEGNLRVATTIDKVQYKDDIFDSYKETNTLYILDEDLKEIGKIDNLGEDEKIYSVRFIGKLGYIVTFRQIDPLFVIDLSDPRNPEIKGELKIPGYSSYLHPYDENHIIGIGFNTRENEYGGTVRTNMKMSMFDVSDLENPKEIFNINIGERNAYSEIIDNHKALFYNKSKNLIGFPARIDGRNLTESILLFKINLEENEFEKYEPIDNSNNIDRMIYIKDVLYVVTYECINAYDINTLEKLNSVYY